MILNISKYLKPILLSLGFFKASHCPIIPEMPTALLNRVSFGEQIAAPEKPSALLNHIHLLQELKQKFASAEKPASTPRAHQSKKSQTEAYLAIYKKEIESISGWVTVLERHKTMIDEIIAREKKFADTHYVFYHAHPINLIILHDFIKQIESYFNLQQAPADFLFMRFKGLQKAPYTSALDFLKQNTSFDDHKQKIRNEIISVNLSLFGNHHSGGECTFDYFLNNRSQASISAVTENSLYAIFNHYHLNNRYISALIDVQKYLASPTGNLVQIFIPKKQVNTLLYLAKPLGRPYDEQIIAKYFDNKLQYHTKIEPILKRYIKNPHKIKNLDALQARLVFLEPLFTTESDIKLFQYNTVSAENMRLYQQKMKELLQAIMADYFKRSITTHSVPLATLQRYIRSNNLSFSPLTNLPPLYAFAAA